MIMKRYSVHFAGGTEAESTSEKSPFLTTGLIPLGSVLVAGLGLLVQNVPWWVTGIVISYVTAVLVVLVIPAAIRLYRLVRKWVVGRAVTREYLPTIRRFMTTLMPQLEDSRTETVVYVWRNATSLDEGRRLVQLDYDHIRTLQDWLSSIDRRLSGTSKSEFEQVCGELGHAIFQYNRLCEQAHREIEAVFAAGTTNQQQLRYVKQEWNNARDKHNHTIKTWEDIAKNINHDVGENVCVDHYGLLKTIG
jgi:hypothetical protein